ncbi:MAG: ABC transporter substrate-binding protein, partial [Fimbriimonadaceae bacterium]|nr:ABC transporter substrate-binding protein [Alphaproteobacteria bacterium]
ANTEIEGKTMAVLAQELGMKRVCVSGFDYAYSHDLFDAFERNLPDSIVVAGTFHVKLGTTDYSALISQLMAADCDGVAGAIWGGGFIAFAKQGKPFGLFDAKKFIWGAEVGSHEMAGNLGADYPANMWANSYDLWYHEISDAHAAFHDALAKIEGSEQVNMWPITTYTAMKFLAAAIAKAGTTEADALSQALEGLTIDTPLGPRTIDAETHRVNTGEFWGPMKPSDKGDFYEMNPVKYYPG